MKRHLLVAGTGRMGLDSGLFFLRRGWRVTWLSGDPGRRDEFARRIARELRRLEDADPGADRAGAAQVRLLDDAGDLGGTGPDLFLEAVREDLAQKRSVFRRIAPLLARDDAARHDLLVDPAGGDPPALSRRALLLPAGDHPARRGGRPARRPATGTREPCWRSSGASGCTRSSRAASNAFAVNRLLLPLQAEAVRALRAGWPAAVVDGASATPLVPFGQLALMDAVGLDVIAAAVANYRRRLPPGEAQDYAELGETLDELIASGKRGKKNRDGFLSGSPLPWAADARRRGTPPNWRATSAPSRRTPAPGRSKSGDIDAEDLDLAFSSLFAAAVPLDEERRRCRDAGQLERLARLRRATGRSYFLPETRCRATVVAP